MTLEPGQIVVLRVVKYVSGWYSASPGWYGNDGAVLLAFLVLNSIDLGYTRETYESDKGILAVFEEHLEGAVIF